MNDRPTLSHYPVEGAAKPDLEKMGLRERKRRETYLRIEDEATRLFLEKSYDEVTLEEICEAAVVSRRTFFNYFQSKDHVAVGTVPPSLTDEDYEKIATFTVPEGMSMTGAILSIMAQRHIDHAEAMGIQSINPELSALISQRRIEILRRNPTLGLSKLNSFEKIRARLADALLRNFEAHPEHRSLPDSPPQEEARISVVAIIVSLWTSSTLVPERPEAHLTRDTVQSTVDKLYTIYSSMTDDKLFPAAPTDH
ncbi:TetR/AcrR family transcriptional regulator [Corynebacterium anserum]|nr:helix-turn-helix domain-containing protein [Corynebacterium anserum]